MANNLSLVRQAAFTLLLVFHLTLTLVYNLSGAGIVQPLAEGALLSNYGRLTGLACTYGFFAPQVASPCFLEIGLAASGDTARRTHMPRFAGNDARLRYHSFTTVFLDLAPRASSPAAAADTAYNGRLARAFARSIAEREAKRANERLLSCRVYVYRHPSLREYACGATGTISNLYTYAYPTL